MRSRRSGALSCALIILALMCSGWMTGCGGNSGSTMMVMEPVVVLTAINGTGVGSSAADAFFLTTYNANTGQVRWHVPINVGNSATLRVTSDTVYLLAEHTLQAYRLDTGARRWSYGPADDHSYFLDIDALTSDTLYVTEVEGAAHEEDLVAFNTADGTPRWSFHTGADVQMVTTTANAYSAELSASSDLTQQAPPESLRAFAAQSDGTPQWSLPVTQFGSFSDLQLGPDKNLYLNGADGLYALHTADGSMRWHVANPLTGQNATGGQLAFDATTVYATLNGQILIAARLSDGKVLWQHTFAQPSDLAAETVPCVTAGRLVLQWNTNNATSRHMQVLSTQAGAVVWSGSDKTKDLPAQAQVLCDAHTLYLVGASVHAWHIVDGMPMWQASPAQIQTPALAVLAQNQLYLEGSNAKSATGLYAIDTTSGKTLWQVMLQSGESILLIGVVNQDAAT